MASKEFIELFKRTITKINNNNIVNKIGDHIFLKHFYETSKSYTSYKYPIVKDNGNLSLFLDKLEELHRLRMNFYDEERLDFYWDEIGYEECVLAHTFYRATIEDMENPIEYLTREISFLKNELVDELYDYFPFLNAGTFSYAKLGNTDINVFVIKNMIGFESNHCMSIDLINEEYDFYFLPDVHFDLSDDVAYIKGIQTGIRQNDKKNKWSKLVARTIYKVNEGVDSSDERFLSIPPGHLLSLSIVISMLKKQGYNKFAFPTYHPLRNEEYRYRYKEDAKKFDKSLKKADMKVREIQHNLSDRLLYTALRYADVFKGVEILDYGDDMGYLILDTSSLREYDNTHILHVIYNGMNTRKLVR